MGGLLFLLQPQVRRPTIRGPKPHRPFDPYPPLLATTEFVEPALHMLSWTEEHSTGHTQYIATFLDNIYNNKDYSRETRKLVGVALSIRAAKHTTTPGHIRAESVLKEFSDLLVQHERVLLMGAQLNEDISATIRSHESILRAIDEAIAFPDINSTIARYWQSRTIDVISPILNTLITNGHVSKAVEILARWHGAKAEHVRRSPVLVTVATQTGVTHVVEGHASFGTDIEAAHNNLIDSMNRFLSLRITVSQREHQELHRFPRGMGIPNFSEAPNFALRMAQYLSYERLAPLISEAKSWIMIPGLPVPAQALTLAECGRTLPLSVSFEEPAEDRKITNVLLWEHGTILGEMEATAVTAYFSQAGFSVHRISEDSLSVERFEAEYTSPHWDVIWISTHAEFAHYEAHRSSISISPHEHIDLARLGSLAIPATGRRLLVLNACDGGMVNITGGPMHMGLAANVASQNQAVISHLWPTNYLAAAAFGTVLASYLANRHDFFEAYTASVSCMRRGRQSVVDFLRIGDSKDHELIERINASNIEFGNLENWASPAFYE